LAAVRFSTEKNAVGCPEPLSARPLYIEGLSRTAPAAAYRVEAFMLDSEDTHEQNVRERIERDGPEAEIGRQADVERLKPHIEAFYEHGSRADVVGLCEAFESLERKEFRVCDLQRACLLEEIVCVLGRANTYSRVDTIGKSCKYDQKANLFSPNQGAGQ